MDQSFFSKRLNPTVGATCGLLLTGMFACGPGGAPDGWGAEDGHGDILIASTAPNGGRVAVEFDFSEEVVLGAPQCIGGDGDECDGGIVLFGSESPGFDALFEDEPGEGLYALPEGIDVSLELVDHSPEASFFINGTLLDTAGASVVLGKSREGLHVHGEFQLAFPAGTETDGEYFLAFRLTTDSPAFAASEDYVLDLHADAEHMDEHDDHEHEEHEGEHDDEHDHGAADITIVVDSGGDIEIEEEEHDDDCDAFVDEHRDGCARTGGLHQRLQR